MLHLITILLFTLVIDAGHGGKDPGAVGKKLRESDLNLIVSQKLAEQVRQAYPEVNVLLTRNDDRFLTLQGRADFVNRNKADLFICIHTNSAKNAQAAGAETFVLGTEKMDKNLDVAMRENSVIQLESDYQTTYQGFDPTSIESYIMFSLMQNTYLDRSLQFASLVQRRFSDDLHRADRGVRQAAFWVLLKSACPSVLVELGFISNPEEERYMASDAGQNALAGAIFNAFSRYYQKAPIVRSEKSEKPKSPESSAKPAKPEKPATPAEPVQPAQPEAPIVSAEAQYAVQIFSSRTLRREGDPALKGLTEFGYLERDGIYKYYTCPSATREEATQCRNALKDRFPGCFIIKL